ncbi:MAG TPA: hypothetical protein VIN59_09300 [Alphaproteobacteria bacterium]
MSNDSSEDNKDIDSSSTSKKLARAGMQVAGGVIPFVGGILSAAAGAWSEAEQEKINKVFQQWLQMLENELRDKAKTIVEIMARVDMQEEKVKQRIESEEYQSIMKKAFHKWSNIDSESKRVKVRNLLSHAAVASLTSDDVVKMFLDWLNSYSDFHFEVIGEIYRNNPISRGKIWSNLGKSPVAENSAEADLYKLLIRDLSTGGVIRQQRAVDGYGNFIKKERPKTNFKGTDNKMKSAFDHEELYELTELGQQFVHYAMTEIVPRIEFKHDVAA